MEELLRAYKQSVDAWYAAVSRNDKVHCDGEHAYMMWCLDRMQDVAGREKV